jgi:hypothetical protein
LSSPLCRHYCWFDLLVDRRPQPQPTISVAKYAPVLLPD